MIRRIENIYRKDAEYFLETYNLNDIKNIPVDLTKLFSKLEISVLPFSAENQRLFAKRNLNNQYGDILSAVCCNGDNIAIFYTPNTRLMSYMHDYHDREAIVYELGYICKTGNGFHIHGTHSDKDEAVLNFVGELLIPEEHLWQVLKELLLPTTKALEDIFQVSHNTVIHRLKQLNIKTLIAGYNY